MYKKDYILRIIEDFAKMLGVILGFKLEGDYKKAEEAIDEALKKYTETDLAFLLSFPPQEMLIELTEKRQLSEEQLHVIAELLFQQAEIRKLNNELTQTQDLYLRSYTVYNWLNENQKKTFSVEIAKRCSHLKEVLAT